MTQDPPDQPAHVESMLAVVRDNALQLLAAFPQPPSALRIQAGGVSVEAEWPGAPPPTTTAVAVVGGSGDDATLPVAGSMAEEDDALHYLRAPAVGVFFRAPEPGAKPFVEVGDTVLAGQQVAIIEVMKLMIPVHSDIDGRIDQLLKSNGAAVEYDEPLIAVTPWET